MFFVFVGLEDSKEGRLGKLDVADHLHALFAFLLFFKQFSFSGNVAAVAFGKNVLSDRVYRFARDDLASDRALNGNLELLAGDLAL